MATKSSKTRGKKRSPVFTIGHSNRTIEDFIGLLRANCVQRVIDIRTIPKSRHNPQFNEDALSKELRGKKIGYVHLKKLGGLRHARADSMNQGWHNTSFRGFADYMQTEEFEEGLARAMKLAEAKPSALMCAEAVPWRCHRSLVADALVARGIPVMDIISASAPRAHTLTPFACVRGTKITYPDDKPRQRRPAALERSV